MPETDERPPGAELVLFDPAEIEDLVTTEVGGSALFASRFRECAARALLLPRRDPGRRSPLWQQRQRSAPCSRWPASTARSRSCSRRCASASRTSTTCRAEGLLMRDHASHGGSRWSRSRHRSLRRSRGRCCSATSGAFMYEGDTPLAEKRPPRSRWIRACSPSSSGGPSCASSSTPGRGADRGASCSGSPRTAELARPRAVRRTADGRSAVVVRSVTALCDGADAESW